MADHVMHINTNRLEESGQNIEFEDLENNVVIHRYAGPMPGTSRALNIGNRRVITEADRGHAALNEGNTLIQRKQIVASDAIIEVLPDSNQSKNRKKVRTAGQHTERLQNIFLVTDQAEQILDEQEPQIGQNIEMSSPSGREISIQIESNSEEESTNHLSYFLLIMYYMGLSTFKPGRNTNKPVSLKSLMYWILQQIRFWAAVIASLLHSLRLLKHYWLYFVVEEGIINFVKVGFRIVAIFAEIFTAHLFSFRHGKIRRMLRCLKELEAFDKENEGNKNRFSKKMKMMVIVLTVTSLLVCFVKTATADGIIGWSLKKVLTDQSIAFSYGLFTWTVDDLKDDGIGTMLAKTYGDTLAFPNWMMGVMGTLMAFCSHIQLEFTINIMIATGWTLKYYIGKLAKKVKNIDFHNYNNEDDCAELQSPVGYYAEYKKLKEANKAINVVFDGLLKIMHANNMILFTDFLMHILERNVTTMEFLFLLYNIIKLGIAYHIAKKSHGYNAIFQHWIRDWAMHSNDPMFLLRVPAILDDMTKEPLGLGNGDFIIGETFIFKFIGMVGSVFMLQVDQSDGDTGDID